MTDDRTVPATWFEVDDVLAPGEHQILVDYVVAHWGELQPSMVSHPGEAGGRDVGYRRSALLGEPEDIWPIFAARLDAVLPQVRRVLGVPWFEVERIERQLTVHGDGDFFRIHADSGGEETRDRMVTFVYYFVTEPEGFTGGDLVLHDGVLGDDGFVHPGPVARVLRPVDNRIVFFPSWAFHEVTPVRSARPGLAGHRFTMNGWFRARVGAEATRVARARRDPCP